MVEFFHKIKKNNYSNDVYVGFTDQRTISQIINFNKKFKLNYNIILLSNFFEIKFFHKILYLKKKIFGFNKLIVGDINYYLFKEFFKYSNYSIIIDDGTSALQYKKYIKGAVLFSIFKRSGSKRIQNNYDYLKERKKKNQKIDNNLVYIIGSASVERGVLPENYYLKIISNILIKNKSNKTIYIPHRLENLGYLKKQFRKINFYKLSIPLEAFMTINKILPHKVYGFYSSALFNINKIFDNLTLINIDYSFDYLRDNKIKERHKLIKKQNVIEGIKNFIY